MGPAKTGEMAAIQFVCRFHAILAQLNQLCSSRSYHAQSVCPTYMRAVERKSGSEKAQTEDLAEAGVSPDEDISDEDICEWWVIFSAIWMHSGTRLQNRSQFTHFTTRTLSTPLGWLSLWLMLTVLQQVLLFKDPNREDDLLQR